MVAVNIIVQKVIKLDFIPLLFLFTECALVVYECGLNHKACILVYISMVTLTLIRPLLMLFGIKRMLGRIWFWRCHKAGAPFAKLTTVSSHCQHELLKWASKICLPTLYHWLQSQIHFRFLQHFLCLNKRLGLLLLDSKKHSIVLTGLLAKSTSVSAVSICFPICHFYRSAVLTLVRRVVDRVVVAVVCHKCQDRIWVGEHLH